VKNDRGISILDQLVEAGLELYGLYIMDESQLTNLRRLVDHQRTIYQKPNGDPAYGQIPDLETLEGILNFWREIAREMLDNIKDGIKYNLDSHRIGLIHKAYSVRWEKEARPGIAEWVDNFNEWLDLDGSVKMKHLLLTSRVIEV
jgi:hypothetical protein